MPLYFTCLDVVLALFPWAGCITATLVCAQTWPATLCWMWWLTAMVKAIERPHAQLCGYCSRTFYNQKNVRDRMDELKPELFLQPKKAPKLRCKAAVCRALAPLLPQLLHLAWPAPSTHQKVVMAAVSSMVACCTVLFNWDPGQLEYHSRRCGKLLVSLEHEAQLLFPGTRRWRVKPMLNSWIELCTRMAHSKGNPR